MSIIRFSTDPAPTIPPAGYVTLYVDNADNHVKQIDSSGVIIDLTDGGGIFDGIGTEAEILALDPTTYLGQTWWATDVKAQYKSVTTIAGPDAWQQIAVVYDATRDVFCLSTTQDGQKQDLGQEVFFSAFNDNGSGATELDPKVFTSVGARVGDEDFQDVLKVIAADLDEGSVYGINTTSLAVGEKGKVVTYGAVRDVNTSAWGINDILYVDPTTAGDMTNIKPGINAFNVGYVLKSDATTGAIWINSITSNRVDDQALAIGVAPIFLTADETTPVATTYYLALLEDEGIILEATETVVVPDNSIVAAGQDHITLPGVATQIFKEGLRQGQIEFEVNNASSQERIYFEIYYADADGVPIDSGIVSEPVGDLGVRPIVVLVTSLLDSSSSTIFKEGVRGLLSEDFEIAAGNRVRIHILCEKVGAAGGDKTFTLYFGADHDSFIEAIAPITIDDVEGLEDALDLRVKWLFPWVDGVTYDDRTMTRIGEYTTVSNKETSDYPVPIPIGSADFLMDAAVFNTLSNTSVVYSGHRYIFTDGGWVSQIRVYVTELSPTTNYRIVIIDNTDPANPIIETIDNPILNLDEWSIVSVGSSIVLPGSEFIIYLDALDSASNTILPSHPWVYNGTSQNADPGVGLWNRNNQHTILRINDIDDNAADQSVDLAQVTVGSFIRMSNDADITQFWEYEVTSTVDVGGSFTFGVILLEEGSGGGVPLLALTDWLATVPTPSPTEYAAEANFWLANDPSFADVQGFLQFDGVDQPGNDETGFGVDIRFQQADFSDDWDLVALSGIGGGGGGGGGNVVGPDVSTDTAVSRWDGVNGRLLSDSKLLLTDDGNQTTVYTGTDKAVITADVSSGVLVTSPIITGITPTSGARKVIEVSNTAESFPWLSISYDEGGSSKPGVAFGSGAVALDINLYRESANLLKTDDGFQSATIRTFGSSRYDATGDMVLEDEAYAHKSYVDAAVAAVGGLQSLQTSPLGIAGDEGGMPNGRAVAIGIIPPVDVTVSSVRFVLRFNNNSGNLLIGLYEEDGGTPNQFNKLTDGTIFLTSPLNNYQTITFGTPQALVAGNIYYVAWLLPSSGGAGPSIMLNSINNQNTQAGWESSQNGISTLPATLNFGFNTQTSYWAELQV